MKKLLAVKYILIDGELVEHCSTPLVNDNLCLPFEHIRCGCWCTNFDKSTKGLFELQHDQRLSFQALERFLGGPSWAMMIFPSPLLPLFEWLPSQLGSQVEKRLYGPKLKPPPKWYPTKPPPKRKGCCQAKPRDKEELMKGWEWRTKKFDLTPISLPTFFDSIPFFPRMT